MLWEYQGKKFSEDLIEDNVGFVYIITNLKNDRKYIGKKLFTSSKIKQVKGKKKRIRVESDWRDYHGSNEELKEEFQKLGNQNYKKEILYLCGTLSELSYLETREIFIRDALIKEEYYNSWVSCRINSKNLKKLIDKSL
ncbi:MAG: hypothetical protein PHS04_00605 [Tissierellia bacterium]|nr:hypothetical protein [Tissierellia bacterium]